MRGPLYIAYQVVGDGPRDLMYVPSAFGHVEIFWEHPEVERFVRRVGRSPRIIFDERGTGMSYRPVVPQRLPNGPTTSVPLMDTAGSSWAALFGMSDGGVIVAKLPPSIRNVWSHLIAMG